ncbi:NAD-capped RNA hydrolase DXO1 [Caerostris darwini]|uniref:Decapping nuclease n=1 Tax=Caerostris darwini TaxID=1538125 RepID=A0AAV4WUU0_9ARAC|nr:NAD-capped RNA hydrolase DXO1 [Caerostris darwini]
MDLNEGYEDAIAKVFDKSEDTLYSWILKHQKEVCDNFRARNSNKPHIDFVCYRGLLKTIGSTIYEKNQDWLICATKFNSVIYLCDFRTEDKIKKMSQLTKKEKLMIFWGMKFEKYVTANTPDSEPKSSEPVNGKEKYFTVLKGRLGKHTLLYSAEVDGKDPLADANKPPTECYLELKTSKMYQNAAATDNEYRKFCTLKMRAWWLQSFLAGIPKVVCGFRDDLGIVRKLGTIPVADMPDKSMGSLSPSSPLNAISSFLDFVKKCVVEDAPTIYKFYWKPGNPVTCEKLNQPGEYQVLPEGFTSNLEF